MHTIEQMLEHLWQDYATLNPRAKAIHDLLTIHDERVVNDHIAFRTFDDPSVGNDVLAGHFLRQGYIPGGTYHIAEKKVDAIHLEPPRDGLPKVFISHLLTSEFSPDAQALIRSLVRAVPAGRPGQQDFLWSGVPWPKVSYATYLRLKEESEYAAWVAAFGYRANHFTVDVNRLAFTQDIYELNEFITIYGHKLNEVGGAVKGTPAQLLEQSSTLASAVPVVFVDGTYLIPACYYEFAKRYPGPDGKLFPGFIETSATKLFESTTAPSKD